MEKIKNNEKKSVQVDVVKIHNYDYYSKISMSHAESLAEYSRLEEEKWHLHNGGFIRPNIRIIVEIFCLFGGFGFIGSQLISRQWFKAQTIVDQLYIADYCKFLYSKRC